MTTTPTLSCASIDNLRSSLSIQGASDETIRAYRSDLTLLLKWLEMNPSQELSLEARVALYLTTHRKIWAARTTLRKLTAIRCWAKNEGAPEVFLKDFRTPTPNKQEPHPLPEGIDGVKRMLAVARTPDKRALVALCGLCGLRISEACAVMPEHIDVHKMEMKVVGKGQKTRYVPISASAWEWIRPAMLDALQEGTSVVRVQQRSARASITSMARKAKLRRRVASHDLRATFATTVLDATKDLLAVQQLLGHADPNTTQIYTSVSEARKRDAVEAV